MDPITHGLTGAVIRNLGFKGRAALFVLVFSSVAPDLDYITRLWGPEVFLKYHRGITHGVLALFLFPALLSLLPLFRKRFLYYYALSFTGFSVHLIFDVMNQYGTRIFSPLDWQAYSLDLVFIAEPVIIGSLLLGLVVNRISGERARVVAISTLFFVVSVFGIKHSLHEKTVEVLRSRLDDHFIRRLSPMPNDFLRWWFVAEKDGYKKVGYADLFTDSIYVQMTYPPVRHDPAIEQSKKAEVVMSFLAFSQFPHVEVFRDGGKVEVWWRELSYSYATGDRFVAKVKMDSKGNILSTDFRF
jgi:inner membrane protein